MWKWRFGELPGATDHIVLARDEGGTIRGHFTGLPFTARCKGQRFPISLRVDFMVHPDFQRMGVGGLLIKALTEYTARNFSLAYGFGNLKSTSISIKKGPKPIEGAPIYWRIDDLRAPLAGLGGRDKPPAAVIACANAVLRVLYRMIELPLRAGSWRIEHAQRFEHGPAGSTAYERDGDGFHIERDGAFLRWRFDRHPEMEYHILYLSGRKSPAGYAVLTVKEYQGFRIGFIVDILVRPPTLLATRYLLIQALRWFREHGIDAVNCLITGSNGYSRALRSLAFAKAPRRFTPRELNLFLRVFDPSIDKDYATDPDNWLLTWADTDLV